MSGTGDNLRALFAGTAAFGSKVDPSAPAAPTPPPVRFPKHMDSVFVFREGRGFIYQTTGVDREAKTYRWEVYRASTGERYEGTASCLGLESPKAKAREAFEHAKRQDPRLAGFEA